MSTHWLNWRLFNHAHGLENARSSCGPFITGWALEGLATWHGIGTLLWLEAIFDTNAFAVGNTSWFDWNELDWGKWLCIGWCDGGCCFFSWFLADSAAGSWLFEWANLLLVARLDHCAALAMIDRDDLVVEALVFNAVWVLWILPGGSSWTDDSLRVHTVAVIVGRNTGGSVEEGSVATFAAVVCLDAGFFGAY